MQAAGRDKETDSPSEASEGTRSCRPLDFTPEGPGLGS